MKKLTKSRNNKMLSGVCAGIAEYFNIDPTLVRLVWAVLICCAGTGILAYIICAIIIPYGDDPSVM
ncbi:MAG: PspC domain-containing protein [Oscillospiraceae bacterium]|nr:PspC domain-containing protein [Oscillospiraceae bacterium]